MRAKSEMHRSYASDGCVLSVTLSRLTTPEGGQK